MSLITFVYLAGTVENVQRVLSIFSVIAGLGCIGLLFQLIDAGGNSKHTHTRLVGAATTCAVLAITTTLLPPERTMYMMAAVSAAEQLVTSEVAEDVKDILKLKLKQYKQIVEKDLTK
jgi:hypothetical protein